MMLKREYCACGCGNFANIGKRYIWGHNGWNIKKPLNSRFWNKVDKSILDGCWIWKGSLHRQGYGSFSYKGRLIGAHRMSWILAHGNISDGMKILHKCDTPSCVNPNHLFEGTQSDNMIDCAQKGRSNKVGINIGRHVSKKTRKLLSILNTGKQHTKEAKRKIGIASTNYHARKRLEKLNATPLDAPPHKT